MSTLRSRNRIATKEMVWGVDEALKALKALDALPPRLKFVLRSARVFLKGAALLQYTRERAVKEKALLKAVLEQDEEIRKRSGE